MANPIETTAWRCGLCGRLHETEDAADRCCTCPTCGKADIHIPPGGECVDCANGRVERARAERWDGGEKVRPEDCHDMVWSEVLDRYFDDPDPEWIGDCAGILDAPAPDFPRSCHRFYRKYRVYDCRPVRAVVDVEDVVSAMDGRYGSEDWRFSDNPGFGELEAAIDRWNGRFAETVWVPDTSRPVSTEASS